MAESDMPRSFHLLGVTLPVRATESDRSLVDDAAAVLAKAPTTQGEVLPAGVDLARRRFDAGAAVEPTVPSRPSRRGLVGVMVLDASVIRGPTRPTADQD